MKMLVLGSLERAACQYLEKQGVLAVMEAPQSAEELEAHFIDGECEVAVIDLLRYDLGLRLVNGLRQKKIHTPLIGLLTEAEDWSAYRAKFLELGGDDLLRNPPNARELLASARAALRRFNGALLEVLEFNLEGVQLRVNLTTRLVYVNNQLIKFSNKETALVLYLASSPGKVFSDALIFSQLYWGKDDEPAINIVKVLINLIRKKLAEAHPKASKFIKTTWGIGYGVPKAVYLGKVQEAA